VIRVAVVDDHPHVAIALRTLLDKTPDIQLAAESRRGSEVAALVRQARPTCCCWMYSSSRSTMRCRPYATCAPAFPTQNLPAQRAHRANVGA